MINVKDLNFYYGNHHILKNVSFNIESGELWGITGPNGGGKSTLFRCLLNFLRIDSGLIEINNINIKNLSTAKMAKLVSYVPQDNKTPFSYTVREIVLMGRSPHMGGVFGLKKEDYEVADKALELLGIQDLQYRIITSLSGGQRQLALIARAIAQNSPIMILDEPTSALDFDNQIKIWKTLKKLSQSGKTIITCSHEPNHILWFADKALMVNNGEIVAQGETSKVINSDILNKIYGNEYTVVNINDRQIIQPVI